MASDARDPKSSRAQYDAMLRPDGQIIAFLHRDREIPGIFVASSGISNSVRQRGGPRGEEPRHTSIP